MDILLDSGLKKAQELQQELLQQCVQNEVRWVKERSV
jgi:hypothetical protein